MKIKKIHPYIYILLTFVSVILVGTCLLLLPISYSKDYIESTGVADYISNAFFMSSSAVCVTGLSVMPHGLFVDMTVFGKIVMYLLMQIGGLSIITIAVFFFTIIGGKIGISNSFILRESLNQSSVTGLLDLVKRIVLLSIVIQVIGTLLNWYPIYEYTKFVDGKGDIFKAFMMSGFHSCASFNNAGFDVFSSDSMVCFSSSEYMNYGLSFASMLTINLTTILMIISGGIGIVVFQDIFETRFHWRKMRLHTKLTIITTAVLIVVGTLLLKLTCMDMNWLEALFISVSCRTAGFATHNIGTITPAAAVVCMILMLIGASPCSCGGGIKTTTIAIIILVIVHYAKGKKTKAFHRSISDSQIFKAFVLVNVAIILCAIISGIVLVIQPELGIDATAFEVVSAFSTTGLSRGITTVLNVPNKVLLSVLMLFGRLGPLTIIGIVNKNWMTSSEESIQYVEESVIIG